MTVGDFMNRRAQLTPFINSAEHIHNYRLARGRLKKLRDEIAPMTRFVSIHAKAEDRIQFPLVNDGPVDCNIWHDRNRHRKIQITGAQRRERLNLMERLNKAGKSSGFLGLTENEPTGEFLKRMNDEPCMYSTQKAWETTVRAVRLCIANKIDNRGADTLIIDAPLNYLPPEKWRGIEHDFSRDVIKSPFSEIFLVNVDDNGDQCIRIK